MKVNVFVAAGGAAPRRICWYVGTSDAQVETAMRMQLRVPRNTEFLLCDGDGDVVPVSSTLPSGKHYTLLLQENLDMVEHTTATDSGARTLATSVSCNGMHVATHPHVTSASSPAAKRRRLESDEELPAATASTRNTAAAASPLAAIVATTSAAAAPGRELTPHRPVATIIEQFVSTFTRAIANDDNVSFIPNAGRFALYALYCKLVRDARFHPKREDVFYKMTSMHGKVDRQRVNRYYQCRAEGGETQVVQFKPQGKGVLLRRYRKVGSEEQLEDVVKVAPFVSWLQLDPTHVVALYERFVASFEPIAKSAFRAHNSDKQHEDVHL
jgi:hypothetical protein